MPNTLANIARVASATTGTGTLTLGSAATGCLTFAAAGVANGAIVSYGIEDYDGSGNVIAREVGRGTYSTTGPTLTRSTVYSSTNSGSKISCSGNQHVFVTAAKEDFDSLVTAYNVKTYGAVGDGTTEEQVAIQAAIDAASTAGGGTVYFPAGTYLIGATITLKSKVNLRGDGPYTTSIKAKNSLNSDMLKTANYATLTGANKYNSADGVQYGFEIADLRLDGNSANQTSGNGLVCYAKRYCLLNIVIYDVKQIGWVSEGWYTVSSATHPEQPESHYENVDVQNCGSHGVQYRGPTDAAWHSVFSHQNTGWGIRFETDGSTYNAASDLHFAHVYANTAGGVYVSTRMRIGHLCTESNFGAGLEDVSTGGSSYGFIESYINARTTGSYAILLTGTDITVSRIYHLDGAEDVGGVTSSGNRNSILGGELFGSASTKIGLLASGAHCHFSLAVTGYSGVGGIGVQFAATLTDSFIDLRLRNNKQGYNCVGTGLRNTGRISVEALATQTLVGTDFASGEAVDVVTLDASAATVAQRLFPAGSVSSPGVGVSADRNTGLYSSAADILNVTAGGAEVVRFITSGGVGWVAVGAPNLYAGPGSQFPLLQINRATAQAGGFFGCWQNNATAAAQVVLAKSKSGTVNTHSVIANNDVIGEHHFVASDGTAFIPAALIKAEVDGTPGTNDMPSRLIFSVTADGAATVTERLRIASNGLITATGTLNATTALQQGGVALGTAAFKATGTSGNTVPLLDGANTWSANQVILKAGANMNIWASSGDATHYVSAIAGQAATFRMTHYTGSAASDRWLLGKDATAEGGSNAGSDLACYAYSDAGSFLHTVFTVQRSTGVFRFNKEIRVGGDTGGQSSHNTFTNVSDVSANSTGVGSIKFKGSTSRDSAGFIKIYIGTTAYYVPVFAAITG